MASKKKRSRRSQPTLPEEAYMDIDISTASVVTFEDFLMETPKSESVDTIEGSSAFGASQRTNDMKSASSTDLSFMFPSQSAYPFKRLGFRHAAVTDTGKSRRYNFKNLKQITLFDSQIQWPMQTVKYLDIEMGPSVKPELHCSDLTGIPSTYTDPRTKMRFASTGEFSYIRTLPFDLIQGYLSLRGKQSTGAWGLIDSVS